MTQIIERRGETAVVTGASSGIGKVYADRLARRGYDLILVARRTDQLGAVAADASRSYGVRATPVVADLADPSDLGRVAALIRDDPSISFHVNNAGLSKAGTVANARWADFETMTRVNIMALSRLTLAVLPGLKARDRGIIVNVGSAAGFLSQPGMAFYGGTKAFILNFTRGLQQEVAGTGVTVQLVAPAAIATEIWDVAGVPLSAIDPAKVMTAEDCVDAALRGLDLGEPTTIPSLDDPDMLARHERAAADLLDVIQTSRPAARYAPA